MTDLERAKDIQQRVDALNDSLRAAHREGLRAEVSVARLSVTTLQVVRCSIVRPISVESET